MLRVEKNYNYTRGIKFACQEIHDKHVICLLQMLI